MIEVQQGTPGSGKSAVAVARALDHLRNGGVVAANFSLVDGWSDVVASKHWLSKLSAKAKSKRSRSLWRRYFRVDSLSAIKSIDPKALAEWSQASDSSYREGQGLLILDEAQLIFNSRQWDKNFGWIEFFTQHRKLGWNVILISHTIEMIDSQIRPLAEYESRFRNLQKVKLPVLGCSLCPFPSFLVVRRYAGLGAGASVISDRNLYPLPLWAARLYDSCLVFSAAHWGSETPARHCGPPPSLGGGAGAYSGRVFSSTLHGPHWDQYVMTAPAWAGQDPILLTDQV